jgi:fructan beta-fructosidase
LKRWIHLSDFGKEAGAHTGVWECPDLFPMRVEESGDTLWTLLCSINPGAPNGGSGTQYFIGHFDGTNFSLDADFAKNVQDGKAVWLDYGRDNYAGVTWSDVPRADGRRLFLGWMSNWDYAQIVPTTRWRSAMTLPRELNLRQTPAGYRLYAQPVSELQQLHDRTIALKPAVFSDEYDISGQIGTFNGLLELELELESADGTPLDVALELSNAQGNRYQIGCNTASRQYYADRRQSGKQAFSEKFAGNVATAPRISDDKIVRLRFFLDAASAELFADGGATVMTDVFFPESTFTKLRLLTKKGKIRLIRAQAYTLKRIW